MKKDYKINGNKITFSDYVDILNPTTNKILGQVPALDRELVNNIYNFAFEKQKIWESKTISERAVYLKKWASLILENKEKLAKMLVDEIAKNYNDSLTEIVRSVEYLNYTIEEMYRIETKAKTSEQFYGGKKDKIAIIERKPVGIVLVISPFNYPVNLSISKIAPALIAGNVVIFKPATQGSLVAIELVDLFEKTGAFSGIINLVTGRGRDISDYLITHPKINFINFTGSTNVGKYIASKTKLIPLIMELGGKDAAIILDNDNLEENIKDIVNGAFSYSGQRCTAIKRLLVFDKYKNEVESLLLKEVKKLSVGDPIKNNFITPLIDNSASEYLDKLLKSLNPNAKIILGGNHKDNLFYPTIVKNVIKEDRLAKEEQFGPILPIITFKNDEELIAIHNDTDFGLQASIYGTNINRLLKIANKLNVGTVNFNKKPTRGPDNFPFIGYKDSGLGVQGIRDSILSMTKPKIIVINIS